MFILLRQRVEFLTPDNKRGTRKRYKERVSLPQTSQVLKTAWNTAHNTLSGLYIYI